VILIAALRDDIRTRYETLVRRLIDYRRLAADDAARLSPAIDVRIMDRRK